MPTLVHICGLWSYEKEVPGLASNEDVHFSISSCRSMVESKGYAPTNLPHLNIELVFPVMTVQSYVSAGAECLQNGDTTCKGVTRVIRGRVIKRLIQHAKVFITLQEEKFEMSSTSVSATFSAEWGHHVQGCHLGDQGSSDKATDPTRQDLHQPPGGEVRDVSNLGFGLVLS